MDNRVPYSIGASSRAYFEETSTEKMCRKHAGFPDLEARLPKLPSRFSTSLLDNLSSYLGARNPLARAADPATDTVWLLDNTAFPSRSASSGYQAEFLAAYFRKDSGQDVSRIVADVAEKLGIGEGDVAEGLIAQRVQPFLDAVLPARSVDVAFAGGEGVQRLGPSARNGISSDIRRINTGSYQPGQIVKSSTVNIQSAVPSQTFFAAATGWAVISDIDDTIKITQTTSPTGALRTTFAEEARAVQGMPELYAHINQQLGQPAFFYLSASPYLLYPFLRQFREQFYPPGTMILRDAPWGGLAGLLLSLTQGTQAYKVDRMEKIHAWLPKRRFIFIGDSTQTDPESSGEMYRKYNGWIGAIFIRKVTGVAGMDDASKNSDERFAKAFDGVPREVWHVFTDPAEVAQRIADLPPAN